MNEKLTSLAKRLRPFIAGQIGSMASTGVFMTEGPDIDIIGQQIGRGGDTILLFDSAGAPVAEFAFTSAGFDLALAASTAGDVIQIPAGTVSGNHTIPADITVFGFGWNTALSGTIINNGVLMFCEVTGTLTIGDKGTALYMVDTIVGGINVARTLRLVTDGYTTGSQITAEGTGNGTTEGGAYLTAKGRYEGAVQLQSTLSTALKQYYRWISSNDVLRAQLINEATDQVIRDLMEIDSTGNMTLTNGMTIEGHLVFNAIIGGLTGNGVTDDTTALQTLINTATANGTRSATIYFPPGVYLIGGALQDTGDFNGQILLPEVAITDPQITISFIGALRPPMHPFGTIPNPGGYSVLKSSQTGGSGTAAVLTGGNGDFPVKNNVEVVIKDLVCLAPDNPSLTWWNISTCQGGRIDNLFITVVPWTTASEPTHANAYGIKLPQWGQSNYTHVDGLMIGGHYTGLLQGELAIVRGLVAGLCKIAVELTDHQHANMIISMQQTACTYGIKATGINYCDILQYDAEHYTSPAWAVTAYDLDDSNNYLHGSIAWMGVAVGGAVDHSFTINGGANVITHEIGKMPSTGLHYHVTNEDHSAECNGSATLFGTDLDFWAASTQVYVNGIRQRINIDYTEAISLNSVTLTTAPETNDVLLIDYLSNYEDGVNMSRRVLISEQTPTGTGTVTWSSISSGYKSLEIEYVCRSTQAVVTSENMRIYFNNDTTLTNYRSARGYTYAAGTTAGDGGADSNIDDPPAAGATAGSCTAGLIKVINYASTTFRKQAQCQASSRREDATIYEFSIYAGVEWENAAAISRVDLVLAAGNFDTGSTFRLYGVY